jgi:glycerate 2-kinase
MHDTLQLRTAAREIFDETLHALDPQAAIQAALLVERSSLKINGQSINIENGKIYSVAIGKAAAKMAAALDRILDSRLTAGVISSSAAALAQTRLSSRWQQFIGGHPQPNDQSLAAARASFTLLDRANGEGALVIFLVSGGGSAMIEWPAYEDISLADLTAANKILVDCGASIAEINSVRRAFSAVKGGGLASHAPHAEQITLIVSDVPNGEGWNVASGPSVSPAAGAPNAQEVVSRYHLVTKLPRSILGAVEHAGPLIQSSTTNKPFVLLDNQSAVQSTADAAQRRGFISMFASDIADQPIEEGCQLLMKRIESVRAERRGSGQTVAVISGGEFACPVRGNGIGGRNLETALRVAATPNFNQAETVALCIGTDGIDGNSPANGAIVDSTTMARAQAIGLEAEDFLRRSDSYSFFVALGDVVATGQTGTNVRDLRILLTRT